MTAAALRGLHSTDPQPPDWANNPKPSIEQPCPFHPDVIASARAIGMQRDRDLRHLQRLYDRFTANADADYDFGGHVLTYLRRRGSVPVDIATGERATKRLMKEANR